MIGRRGRHVQRALLSLAALTLCAAPSAAAPLRGDRESARAYLTARYELLSARLAAMPFVTAAAGVAEGQLAAGCPGVLKGDPQLGLETRGSHLSPRARGEMSRRLLQFVAAEQEIYGFVYRAANAPTAAAQQRFAEAVAALHWSNPSMAATLAQFSEAGQLLVSVPPDAEHVCAELRLWAQSGFNSLPGPTAELRAHESALSAASFGAGSIDATLTRDTPPAQRGRLRRVREVTGRLIEAERPLEAALERLQATLGEPHTPYKALRRSQTIAHGYTYAGSRFTVTRERHVGSGCRTSIGLGLDSTGVGLEESIFISGSPILCIAGHDASREPFVSCESEEIEVLAVTPGASRVRLRLSDGRTILTRTIHIGRAVGGPADIYVQAVEAQGGHPVSIAELGRDGRVLRTVRLRQRNGCHEGLGPEPRRAANLRAPNGVEMSIDAYPSSRHRADVLISGGPTSNDDAYDARPTQKLFATRFATECPPNGYTVIYGVLNEPGASVIARGAAGETPLSIAPLPASINAKGRIAYGAFAQTPAELMIRSASGATLARESLAAISADTRGFCEGFAEP